MNHADVTKKIVSGFAWELGTRIIIQAISWVSTFLVARMLNPSDYGVVAVSGVFTGIFLMFSNMGLSAGLVNKDHITHEDQDAVFWLSLLLSVMLYAALYLGAPFISTFYPDMPLLTTIIRTAGLMMIFSSLNIVPMAMVMRRLNFRFGSLVDLVGQFIITFGTLGMAYKGYGPWSLIIPVIGGQIFSVLIYSRHHERFPRLAFNLRNVFPLIKYGTTLISARMLEFIQQQVGTFISGNKLGKDAVGHYFYANQLASIPMSKLGGMFQKIAFPALSSIKRSERSAADIFLMMHHYLILCSFPILVGMALVARDLTVVAVTEKWLPMVPVLQLVCFLNLFRISAMLIPATLEACGNANASLRFQLVSVIVIPVAMLIGVKHGLVAMVVAWCAVYPLIYIYIINILLRQLNISPWVFIKSWLPTVTANLVMSICVLSVGHIMLSSTSLSRVCVLVSIGMLAYALTLRFIFPAEWINLKRGLAVLRNKAPLDQD